KTPRAAALSSTTNLASATALLKLAGTPPRSISVHRPRPARRWGQTVPDPAALPPLPPHARRRRPDLPTLKPARPARLRPRAAGPGRAPAPWPRRPHARCQHPAAAQDAGSHAPRATWPKRRAANGAPPFAAPSAPRRTAPPGDRYATPAPQF